MCEQVVNMKGEFQLKEETKESQEENPLLNHLILNRMLFYLRTKDLKSCRTACAFWNQFSWKFLKQGTWVKLNPRTLHQYLRTFPSSFTVFHTSFHFDGLTFDRETEESTKVFLKLHGDTVEELHFSDCRFSSTLEVIRLLSLPKLTTVSFTQIDISNIDTVDFGQGLKSTVTRLEVTSPSSTGRQIPIHFPWDAVLSVLPQLKVLHAQVPSSEELTAVLTACLTHGNAFQLKELSAFLTTFNESHMNVLAALGYPLKSLDICHDMSNHTAIKDLHNLLEGCSGTLENLKLFQVKSEPESEDGGTSDDDDEESHGVKQQKYFPRVKLPNLKYLEVMCDSDSLCRIPMDFLAQFPALQVFSVNEYDGEILEKLHMDFKHTGILGFSIETALPLPATFLWKLTTIFPFLNKLALFLDDETVRIVFTSVPNLQELTALGCDVTDEGITGISAMALRRNYKNMNDFRKWPYIGNLKKLRKFVLFPTPMGAVTDDSIVHGLMHLRELRWVEMSETSISDRGFQKLLRAQPNLVFLSAKYQIDRRGNYLSRPQEFQLLQ